MTVDKKYIYAYTLKNAIEHSGKAVLNSVIAGLFNHGLTKDKIKEIIPEVNSVLKEVNSWDLTKQKSEFLKYSELISHRPEREGLPELPNVSKKGVIMRFAPAATGPLHIGHIISSMPTSLYVEKYGGKFYVRIEDTDPERTDPDSYSSFKIDCDWLFGNVSKYIIQSDRMNIYYDYSEKLINLGFAYVCTCNNEKFKKLINEKKSCLCRNNSVSENIKKWKKMLNFKGYKDGEAVLRFKSDLNNPNPALRDFPLARINSHKHPRQGKKYRVWPLMNLSVAVDDIEFKMTHIIRGKDHKDNAIRQKMIYKALGLEDIYPNVLFVGRIKFSDIVLSKRKIKNAIKEGKFSGFEDIRLPTIANLRNRGYLPESFKELAIQRGISEVDKVITQKDFFDVLNRINREFLRNRTRKFSFLKCLENESNIKILMPDGSFVFGKSEVLAKKDEIIYFDKFGYAKFNFFEGRGKNKKMIFWFCHD
ncbi:MAG: glutamate--tRNA ligase family protein [Candidatus Pacearchaeota archaeon]